MCRKFARSLYFISCEFPTIFSNILLKLIESQIIAKEFFELEDKYSSNYDTSKIKLDPRFLLCRNDMITVQLIYLGSIILILFLAYLLSPTDISNMKYLFGFPLWVVICTMVCIADTLFVIIWAIKRKKFSLDAKADDSEVNY